MATNTEEIRRKLETQANQRVNPLLKGLSMLTGGLAGEFTGTNEQIRQQRLAKRALMEEQMAALREERMMEYMKAQEGERLRRQLELDEAQRLAASKIRKQELEEKREAQRPSLVGYLKARPDYQLSGSMAMPIPALVDTQSIEEQVAYEKTREQQEQEAERKKSGYMSFYIPGLGQISGTPDNIEETKNKYPQYRTIIENAVEKAKSGEALFTPTVEQDPVTGYIRRKLVFKPGTPISVIKDTEREYFGPQQSPFGNPPAPGTPGKDKDEKPINDIPGFQIRRR